MPDILFKSSRCLIIGITEHIANDLLTVLSDVPDFKSKMVVNALYTGYNIEFEYTGNNYYLSLILLEFFLKGYFRGRKESFEVIP
jgi:hypothetical protein